jgi:predicted DNA binding CopG/RHH family protein
MAKYNPEYIDEEEKDLIESLETFGVNELAPPSKERQKDVQGAAAEFVRQEAKMNIRIDPIELEKIKEYASSQGLKYQTFIKSILHKYITGQLVEKEKAAG